MLGHAGLAQAADCSHLNGLYAIGDSTSLLLAMDRLPQAAFRVERKPLANGKFANARHFLGKAMRFQYSEQGSRIRYFDDEGRPIADLAIDSSYEGRWVCKGTRMERRLEVTAGNGKSFRVDLELRYLEKGPAGELIYSSAYIQEGKEPSRRRFSFPPLPNTK